MPTYFLKVKAELEGVKAMTPVADNNWKFDIQSPQGGEDKREGITVCSEDILPLTGSRGEANFIIKWPGASDQSYIKIISHRDVKPRILESDSGEFVTILAMECRNLEPVAWHPSFDFIVRTTGANECVYPADKVDLRDRDWAEYDEENDLTARSY